MVLAAAAGELEPVVNGTLANRAKAWRIACGEDPDAVLSGPKVRAFFANIMGDVDAVTIDVWAARAAEGRRNDNAPVRAATACWPRATGAPASGEGCTRATSKPPSGPPTGAATASNTTSIGV
jgi:hypothetical protein